MRGRGVGWRGPRGGEGGAGVFGRQLWSSREVGGAPGSVADDGGGGEMTQRKGDAVHDDLMVLRFERWT